VKAPYIILAVTLVIVVWLRTRHGRRVRQGRTAGQAAATRQVRQNRGVPIWRVVERRLGDVGLIASREIRERVRGRIFRFGTLIILVAIAAAIVIPTLRSGGGGGGGQSAQKVAIVGGVSPQITQAVDLAAKASGDSVVFIAESSASAAQADLRSNSVYLAIIDGSQVVLHEPASERSSPADPTFVQAVAEYLGVLKAYQAAGLSSAQASLVTNAVPVPVHTLEAGSTHSVKATSIIGLVLLFVLLTQYNTWILMGVVQEKSSRVVEVLLAMVRPIQLLSGKVLGIGLVALGQATLAVVFAFGIGKVVGSDLLAGTAPLALGSELLWLVLGYAFYCWVYAAAGSTAERQDQVQALALPLSIPILVAYIFSITVASSGNPDLFFKILAYLPPTAPFCMSVLVGLSDVTWWQFVGSALITVVATVGMAFFAARIYRRAILRTGSRVPVRDLFARTAR
jgi:ABC-2 type transport system permease protein